MSHVATCTVVDGGVDPIAAGGIRRPGVQSAGVRAPVETLLQVVTLAGLIWVGRFLLPKAARADDRFALVCTLASAALVLFLWLLVGFVPVF